MRPKSGLPKRKAVRARPKFRFGFRENPSTAAYRSAALGTPAAPTAGTEATVVSLFSGCGGFDLGMLGGFDYLGERFPALPFRVIAAFDNDPNALTTYRLNLGEHARLLDLATASMGELPPADVMIGGFPCQDFSSCGPKRGFEGERGRLYLVLSDYMRTHRPKLVIGENVPHLAKMRRGVMLDEIAGDFRAQGYRVNVWHLYCPNHGLPQNRERVFFVCVRDDLAGFPEPPAPEFFPAPSLFRPYRTIDGALADLVAVRDETVPNQSQYFVATKATKGAGQGDQKSARGELAYAVRANPKARVHFHYELPRRLTVRECARLQSFPDEFVFPHSASGNMVNIGNAVPPIIGHVVGQAVAEWFKTLGTGDSDGDRR